MALAKKFINDPNDIETEFIEGVMETYPGLRFLDGFPEVKVVFRGDVYPGPPYDKVAVISGGGSGHEPAHAGFVGEGMLTAAICGNLFASPTADAILAGIRTVTGPMGCLLIVENYTGDRLNFGLAAELAKSEGYKVEVVFVGDDCALPPPLGIAGRRGLAGIILVHKVAGAAAAAGLSLADVAAEARYASENVGTVGIALNRCTLPGMVIERRLESGKIEVGPGINGESGRNVIDIQPVDMLVSLALKEILSKKTNYVPITPGDKVVLMVNGLGGTPLGELMIPVGKTFPRLQMDHGLAVGRVYTGSFMTSLDMEGFSISIMGANPSILERLDAETKAPYWPVGVSGGRMAAKFPARIPPCRSANIVEARRQPLQLTEQGQLFEAAIVAAANAIFNLKDILDEWDSKVGDGDCGSNMHRGAQAILEDVKNYPLNDAAKAVSEIGSSMGKAMGGTSGIIYSIFCEAACAQLKTNSHLGVMSTRWAEALAAAIAAVSKYGGARAGDRTLLDALIPASSLLEERLNHGDGPITAFVRSSSAALNGADSTKLMQAQAWGSAKVSQEILSTVPDPGAMAAASWYRAAAILLREKEYYQA